MEQEARYWKCEYENLRRKKKKEIESLQYQIELMKYQQAKSAKITLDLLHKLGLKDKEIFMFYKSEEKK